MSDFFVLDTNSLISAALVPNSTNRIAPDVSITDCRDPKDNKYLELAISANASCIISADKDLLVLHPFRGIPILNAVDFIDNF